MNCWNSCSMALVCCSSVASDVVDGIDATGTDTFPCGRRSFIDLCFFLSLSHDIIMAWPVCNSPAFAKNSTLRGARRNGRAEEE